MKLYHRQRRYGKPLPPKRQVKAHFDFFTMVKEAGENENGHAEIRTDASGNKIAYDVIDGRIQRKE